MIRHGSHRGMLVGTIAVMLLGGFLTAQQSQPAPKPAADVNQLMRGLFFPNSNVVFSTQRQDPAAVKRADEPSGATDPLMGVFGGWTAVENSALLLMDGSDLLMTPGRTCSNGKDAPVSQPDWAKMVDQLRAAAKVAYQAALTKNAGKMFEASDVLNESCSTCHNKYRRATRCV